MPDPEKTSAEPTDSGKETSKQVSTKADSSQFPDGGPDGGAGSAAPNEDKPYGRVATQHDVEVPVEHKRVTRATPAAAVAPLV